jgi:hypothetical protein
VTTVLEPEWDDATRDLALGLTDVHMCPACGGPAYLCQDPERQDDWRAGDPVRCHAQTARLARQKNVTEETNPHVSALMWPVRLMDRGSRG